MVSTQKHGFCCAPMALPRTTRRRKSVGRAAAAVAAASGATMLLNRVVRADVLEGYNFTGVSSPATVAANNVSSGLDVFDPLSRGAGAVASAGSNSFRTTGFKNDGIAASNTDYFQFDASSVAGQALSLTSITASFAGTTSYYAAPGVTTEFGYSLDGTNFTLAPTTVQTVTATNLASVTYDLSGITQLQNVADTTTVYLRFYASGQTATGGFGFISNAGANGLVLNGSLAVETGTPTPTNVLVYDPTATGGGTASTTFANAGPANFMDTGLKSDVSFVNGDTVNFTDLGVNASGGSATVTIDPAGVAPVNVIVNNTVGTYTFTGTGAITGSTALTKTGAGTLIISNSNSYSGGTAIGGGTLQVAADTALGTGNITLSGGTLQAGGTFSTAKTVTLSSTGTIDTQSYSLTLTNGIVGGTAASFTKAGSGTLVIDVPVSGKTLGGVNVNAGTVTIDTPLTTAPFVTLESSTVNGTLNLGTSVGTPVQAEVDSSTTIGGTGQVNVAPASALYLFFSGTSTVNASIGVSTDSSGATSVLGGYSSGRTLIINGKIIDGPSGPGGVTFGGISGGTGYLTGKVFLTGSSTYSGGTTITAGTVVANGSSGSLGGGMVTVTQYISAGSPIASGVLAGNGTVTVPVTVAAGGKITAGSGSTANDSIGSLQTGAQTWNSSAGYVAKVNGTTNAADQLTMSGLTINAVAGTPFVVTLQNVSSGTVLTAGTQYVLAVDTNTADIHVFSNAIGTSLTLVSTGFSVSDGSALTLAEVDTAGGEQLVLDAGSVATPEPTSLLLAGLAATPLVLGRRRRREAALASA